MEAARKKVSGEGDDGERDALAECVVVAHGRVRARAAPRGVEQRCKREDASAAERQLLPLTLRAQHVGVVVAQGLQPVCAQPCAAASVEGDAPLNNHSVAGAQHRPAAHDEPWTGCSRRRSAIEQRDSGLHPDRRRAVSRARVKGQPW